MNSLIYFVPQAVILPEIVIVIGAALLSHAMTTQISKVQIRLSALYIPMLIAGLLLLKMPPTLNEENAIKKSINSHFFDGGSNNSSWRYSSNYCSLCWW